ncbi:MAG: hypothetical protein ACREOL_02515 [Candidatus Dormibacteria bacterium]
MALVFALGGSLAGIAAAGATTTPAGDAYSALPPTRLLDTRLGANPSPLGTGTSLSLQVVGSFGAVSVPADAAAVALNVTTTDTTQGSYLTVYPTGGQPPTASSLNWEAGVTVSNLVIVEVGQGGEVSFYNQLGQTDLVVDLEGYFAPPEAGVAAGSYVALPPARITDTRQGRDEPNAGETLQSGGDLQVQVAGAGGVPAQGVSAVVLNVTVTNTSAASYLTVYPGGATPTASNLNWAAGQTVAHRVVVPLDASGQVSVYNDLGAADVVVDVNGYFTAGGSAPATASLFTPMAPVRMLDTRLALGPLAAGQALWQGMAALRGIPADATAVAANVTVTDTTQGSYLSVYPNQPTGSSDVNWSAGDTVANATLATLNQNGTLFLYNQLGSADVVVDAFGYFVPLDPELAIVTSLAPPPDLGLPYAGSLVGAGGSGAYAFSLLSGAPPTGVSLASDGSLSGTPTAVGSSQFTVEMADTSNPGSAETEQLTLTVALAPNAVLPGVAGTTPLVQGAATGSGTPILDASPGTRLYLTLGAGGATEWSRSEPPSGYPGAATINAALAFPEAPDHAVIEGTIDQCNPYWGLPDARMGSCLNYPDYRGECSFWAAMDWSGTDPAAITANGDGVAAKAIAESALTGASPSAVPGVGELVSWQADPPDYGYPYGHAAVVVGVNPANFTYVVEEMNFGTNSNNDWDIDLRVVSDNAPQAPGFAAPPA